MMMDRFQSAILFGLAAVAMTAAIGAARGEDASTWSTDAHSRVRLIAGTNAPRQPTLRAGLDIMLAPGWKTYWRYPGDSGVPPRFDFSASRNVKAVHVLWPAPERMEDGSGQSIGYHDRVIMPLQVVPADATKPVQLDLKLSYAICEKLCVPAEATAEITLAPIVSSEDAALAQAEARVPKAAAVGADGPLAIRTVRRDDSGPKPRIVVGVTAPKDVAVDLFAEGPTPEWALPLPEPKEPVAGTRQFSFELDGVPPGAKVKGAELVLTLVAGSQAIEVKTRLD
jgi:DsbC/DsbD-like thiol-disulfide interchange protein